MKKYVYFLKGNPDYPNVLCGSSKEEIKNIILESVVNEDEILGIYTDEESKLLKNGKYSAIWNDADNYESGSDFFNNVLKSAGSLMNDNKKQFSNNDTNNIQSQQIEQQIEQPNIKSQKVQNNNQCNVSNNIDEPKYFDEAGIKFKLENNKLYKKSWIEVSNTEEFRIINKSTGREFKKDNYVIEYFDWVEIKDS